MIRRLFAFFSIVLVALALSGCGASPSSTAEKFTVALAKGDIETAKKHCTQSTGSMLEMARSMGAVQTQPDFEFEASREDVDGNRATVYFKDADGNEEKVDLVKIDGQWLVEIRK